MVKRKRRGRVDWSRPRYVPCGECCNGWIIIGITGVIGEKFATLHARRCWCFTSHQQKLDSQAAEKANP
jgi:hypothetical protein